MESSAFFSSPPRGNESLVKYARSSTFIQPISHAIENQASSSGCGESFGRTCSGHVPHIIEVIFHDKGQRMAYRSPKSHLNTICHISIATQGNRRLRTEKDDDDNGMGIIDTIIIWKGFTFSRRRRECILLFGYACITFLCCILLKRIWSRQKGWNCWNWVVSEKKGYDDGFLCGGHHSFSSTFKQSCQVCHTTAAAVMLAQSWLNCGSSIILHQL